MECFRRVLIVAPYGIGDMLFLTPVLRALRLVPSVEKVDLLIGSRTEMVLHSNPHVDEIFPVDKDLIHRQGLFKTAGEVFQLGKRLRKQRYDLLIDYSMRGEYSFLSQFFLRIPVRAGFAFRNRGFFLTHRVPIPHGFQGRHVVDYYCEVAERVGVAVEDRFLEFFLEDAIREEADRLIEQKGVAFEKGLIVSLGGGESWGKDACLRRWPARYFSDFFHQLKDHLDFDQVILIGSSTEKDVAREFMEFSKVPCLDLVGEISLGVAAALIEKARLFVGNDGGLVHISHALYVPVIAFYGPVDPAVYGSYPPTPDAAAIYKAGLECRPCYRNFRYNASCIGRECLQALTPEEVFAILKARDFFKPYLCLSSK